MSMKEKLSGLKGRVGLVLGGLVVAGGLATAGAPAAHAQVSFGVTVGGPRYVGHVYGGPRYAVPAPGYGYGYAAPAPVVVAPPVQYGYGWGYDRHAYWEHRRWEDWHARAGWGGDRGGWRR